MANFTFQLLQKSNKNNLLYYYNRVASLEKPAIAYLTLNDDIKIYIDEYVYSENKTENDFLITNSPSFYLENKNKANYNKLRFIPWYSCGENSKNIKENERDEKENSIVLDTLVALNNLQYINEDTTIISQLKTIYDHVYLDLNNLNFLGSNVRYNLHNDDVTLIDTNLNHKHYYKNRFVFDMCTTVAGEAFLKFEFNFIFNKIINIVWHNTEKMSNIMKNYFSLMEITNVQTKDIFEYVTVNFDDVDAYYLKYDLLSYDLLSNINTNYFVDCNNVADIKQVLSLSF